MSALPYGFRVVGGATEARRLVDPAAALSAHASCDPLAECHREAYLSAFTFGPDFRARAGANGVVDTRGFNGPCHAPFVWFDIDRPAVPDALTAARRLVGYALHRYPALDDDAPLYFFSGSKGFHVGVPTGGLQAAPSRHFHRAARRFADALAAGAGVVIDPAVYDKVRLFRAPNSRHPKTGLHKRRLTHGELMGLTPDRVLQLATGPAPFDLPPPPPACPEAAADWAAAERAAVTPHHTEGDAATPGRLQRDTLDVIRGESVEPGERQNRVFRAAANLTECGTPATVVEQLLTAPARDAGLSPGECRHAITTGIDHARRKAGAP